MIELSGMSLQNGLIPYSNTRGMNGIKMGKTCSLKSNRSFRKLYAMNGKT